MRCRCATPTAARCRPGGRVWRRRIEDFRGALAAVNDRDSHSGCHALRACVAPLATGGRFFVGSRVSGSHRNSLALVQAGQADIAAIDCISLAALCRQAPGLLQGLHTIGSTAAAPGPPLVTAAASSAEDLARLRRALGAACQDSALVEARQALFIAGFVTAPAAAWFRIEETRRAAATLDPAELWAKPVLPWRGRPGAAQM